MGYGILLIVPPTPLMFALAGPGEASSRFGLTETAGYALTGIAWALTLVFAATWIVSVLLLVKRRAAFYVPLIGGAVASMLGAIALALSYLLA
ncbi:hypothetical protein QE381_002569 [Microbacterium sp. SORGH_AS 888]|nr:hypothetical protein [Microbacterium sp. SORGH_AS_0888]